MLASESNAGTHQTHNDGQQGKRSRNRMKDQHLCKVFQNLGSFRVATRTSTHTHQPLGPTPTFPRLDSPAANRPQPRLIPQHRPTTLPTRNTIPPHPIPDLIGDGGFQEIDVFPDGGGDGDEDEEDHGCEAEEELWGGWR
jgi:hypothetical protein